MTQTREKVLTVSPSHFESNLNRQKQNAAEESVCKEFFDVIGETGFGGDDKRDDGLTDHGRNAVALVSFLEKSLSKAFSLTALLFTACTPMAAN